jgi:hypothetical protein
MNNLKIKYRKFRERISKKLHKLKHVKAINRNVFFVRQLLLNNYVDTLKANARFQDDKCLIKHGQKIYSQNEEDGMILEIFNRIGTTNKTFVEFGAGDGIENNTLALLLNNWNGLWIDGSSRSINNIKDHYKSVIDNQRLKVVQAFITKDNINQLISENIPDKEIDLLSVDIDGNDVHIFNEISVINPRVVIMEYNAKFPPPIKFCVDYNPTHTWQADDYMGASLKYIEDNLNQKGYKLVGCDLAGVNAFFVRDDLVGDKFLVPYTAENHYLPAKYYLVGGFTGHQATYKSVEKCLAACSKTNDE